MTIIWTDGVPDQSGYDRYGPAPPYAGGPESDELRVIVEADFAGDYEFDMICVWQNKLTGELGAAIDSGCSCPVPFGDLTWEGMKKITEVDQIKDLLYSDSEIPYGVPDWDSQDPRIADIKAKLHKALRETS